MFGTEDVFIEKIVKRQLGSVDYALIGLYILLFVFVLILVFIFLPYIVAFVPLIIAAAIYGLYYLISQRRLEYEYICTNGTLDIDAIINKKKRKRKVSVRAQSMEILAPLSSPDYNHHTRSKIKTMDLTTNTSKENVWFFVADVNKERVLVLFEPDDRILKDLKRHNPSKTQYTLTRA